MSIFTPVTCVWLLMAVYSNLGWYQCKSTQHVGPNDFWSVAYRYFIACEQALSGGWGWEPPRELARRLDIFPLEKHRERLFWLGLSADLKLVTTLIEHLADSNSHLYYDDLFSARFQGEWIQKERIWERKERKRKIWGTGTEQDVGGQIRTEIGKEENEGLNNTFSRGLFLGSEN